MTTRSEIVEQGLVAGVIGFATVATVMAVANVMAGRSPFYTAALLGGALFYGVTDPSQVTISAGPVFAYNGLHLMVFIGFGMVAAALATLADRGWQLWFIALFFFIFLSFHLFAVVQGIATPLRESLSAGLVWGAGTVASILMAWYLIRVHPRLREVQQW